MEIKNSLAIKAGIIGGVGLAILMVINSGFEVIGSWTTSLIGIIGCCIWLVEIVVLLGTGALAVKYTAGYIKDMNDALMAGALSGGVAGLIGAVVTVILAFITPLISGTTYSGADLPEGLGTGLGLSALSGFGSACCCAPIYIIVAIVLGAIGAVIYQAVAKK